jgi:hypothetical protein
MTPTSPLFEMDATLEPSLRVYRTLDFFSAAALISQHRFMFSRADTFEDKNEGVERLLLQLEATSPDSGCGMGWTDQKSARAEHESLKRSHFISCWSSNPESVAMWSLYSPDYCSVRVSTSIGKLGSVVEELLRKYCISRISEANNGEQIVVAIAGRIAPVTYVSLADIAAKVSRRAKARIALSNRYRRKGQSLPRPNFSDSNYWQRERQRRFVELQTSCSLKDISFQHEKEIRLAVRLGEEPYHPSVLKEQELLNPSHPHSSALKPLLNVWGFVRQVEIPEREFVSCPRDLIESVALDPRCPPHKAAFMKSWFEGQGVPVVQSTCFGYLPASFDVFPDK